MITDRINHEVITTFNAERTGDNIKHYREQKGWTQEELANEIGASETDIFLIEKGMAILAGFDIVAKIATTLGVCAHWLLVFDEEIVE